MSFNNSSAFFNEIECSLVRAPLIASRNSTYFKITFATCILSSLLSPLVVAGNLLILAVFWRNPSLKTPLYLMLGCLAFTDLCTGLISLPFYVAYKLGELMRNPEVYCISGAVTEAAGPSLAFLTGVAMALMAVERWLYMSRRSLLSVNRILFIYLLFALALTMGMAYRFYNWANQTRNNNYVLDYCFADLGAILVIVISFAYCKMFCIVRQHLNQVQTGPAVIDAAKHKKSFYTIVYIMLLFLATYLPYLIVLVVAAITKNYGNSVTAALNLCATVVFSSSLLNPWLYCRRIKEIRDDAKNLLRKLVCKENE